MRVNRIKSMHKSSIDCASLALLMHLKNAKYHYTMVGCLYQYIVCHTTYCFVHFIRIYMHYLYVILMYTLSHVLSLSMYFIKSILSILYACLCKTQNYDLFS